MHTNLRAASLNLTGEMFIFEVLSKGVGTLSTCASEDVLRYEVGISSVSMAGARKRHVHLCVLPE